jgi:hypothetical protein
MGQGAGLAITHFIKQERVSFIKSWACPLKAERRRSGDRVMGRRKNFEMQIAESGIKLIIGLLGHFELGIWSQSHGNIS